MGGSLKEAKRTAAASGHLGFKVRDVLYPGEDSYFKAYPGVAGMAADDGSIILNPYSTGINRQAVIKNEALRLYMRKNNMVPSFKITPEQQTAFGDKYSNNPAALRQTIAARIYSGDPSARATPEQQEYVNNMIKGLQKK